MHIKDIVRNLRKTQTKAERIFWNAVRNRKCCGLKFDRQYPIQCVVNGKKRFFVADFYCAEYKLVIELDGKIHEQQQEYDSLRTEVINEKGISVMRFKNEQILHDMTGVISAVVDCVALSTRKAGKRGMPEGQGE